MATKVSIIVAAWNGDKYIGETLESLLNQSEKDVEILVVDDGSTDKTAEIVKSFSDPRIQYFYQKNSGSQANPRNKGISQASGEFVGFCDQDDIWYADKVEKQIKIYESCGNKNDIGIIISSADLIDDKGKKIGITKVPFEGFLESKESRENLLTGDFITTCSVLVPKKVLNEVGLLDEGMAGVDDYDLFLRISEKYGILSLAEPLCAWRQSESSFSADKAKQYIETEKIFQKIEKVDKSKTVITGHGKNIVRISLALTLEKKHEEASEYCRKVSKYPMSKKTSAIIRLYNLPPLLTYFFIRTLDKLGLISL